jgi:predicted enzyme related to lactoylglutathione lyase
MNRHRVGSISWSDLTVDDAERVRDFYEKVVGWKSQAFDMGGYSDYVMSTPKRGKEPERVVAGICWKRGPNADLPSQWLVYLIVPDLAASLASCKKLGGALVAGPRALSGGTVAVVRDPGGAVCALFQPPATKPRKRSRVRRSTRSRR